MMIRQAFLTHYMRRQSKSILAFSGARSKIQPPAPQKDKTYLLYLHIPFCERLCPYCSFNRVVFDPSLARAYFKALRRELLIYHELGYNFDSIYAGGGTPTILPEALDDILRTATELWPIDQISVETNPNHLTPAVLDTLKQRGVKRLSVGVQSFQDPVLKAIGRYQQYGSGRQIRRRLETVRGIFDTLNVDMIFNFPMQDEQMLIRDLKILRALGVDQITYYPLMAASALQREPARRAAVRHNRERHFYKRIREQLSEHYRPSSAWCFSRRDPDRQSGTHLIDEYIVTNDEYAGLGSGSFGYLQGGIYANTFSIPRYIESLEEGVLPVMATRHFKRMEKLRYDFLMKMFAGGLDLEELKSKHGGDPGKELWKELLFFRLTGGLRGRIRHPQGRLELSGKGYYFMVILMREFFTGVNNFRRACLSKIASVDPEGVRNLARTV